MEYEQDHGEEKHAWGVWSQKSPREEEEWTWSWPFKRFLGHRTEADGSVAYLVKWVGKRW